MSGQIQLPVLKWAWSMGHTETCPFVSERVSACCVTIQKKGVVLSAVVACVSLGLGAGHSVFPLSLSDGCGLRGPAGSPGPLLFRVIS